MVFGLSPACISSPALSPSPDFVLVSQQSLGRGRAAGLLTALGIALGFGVHIVYSVFELVTLVAQSAPLLTAVKIIGGLYLVYIGYKGIRAKAGGDVLEIRAEKAAREPVGKTVWRGVLCNVLNPKAVVYMLSLFTVVLSPATPMWQMAVYGAWMTLMIFIWFALVALMLSVPAVSRRFSRFGHWIDRVCGGALALLGVKVMSGS